MTKVLVVSLVLTLAGLSCAIPLAVVPREVNFLWFNLSTNEIWVTEVVGLPDQSWPGRLMPVHRGDQLSEKASTIMETVRIRDRITIKWKDNGKQGFSEFARSSGGDPPGVAHEATFKRKELELPASTGSATIRFTYLGNDKWRITRLK